MSFLNDKSIPEENNSDISIISAIESVPEEEEKEDLDTFHDYFDKQGFYYRRVLKAIDYLEIKEYYFCTDCKKSYIFDIKPENIELVDKIRYSCDCNNKEIKEISIAKLERLKYKKTLGKIQQYSVCKECNNKFSSFCVNHCENICENHNSDIHKNEELKKFENITIYNILNYLAFFATDLNNENKMMTNKNENNDEGNSYTKQRKANYLRKLIATSIKNYIKFPNYNLYLAIMNLNNAFSKYSEGVNELNEKLFFKKFIEINRNKWQLINLNPKLYSFVHKIDVRQLKFFDGCLNKETINRFRMLNSFENLIELNLAENCIYSIESLQKAKFKNLKNLYLFKNLLNDDNIKFFKNLCCKELTTLDLEDNNFTNYELLIEIGKNFKKLEILKIGSNTFYVRPKNKKDKRRNINIIVEELKKIDFSNIKVFSANNGACPQIAVNTIFPALNLKFWDQIDLRNNKLSNLDVIKTHINDNNKNNFYKGNFIKEIN